MQKKLLDTNFLETRGFRPEIQGLRALALFLVVSYHIWFGRVSGGVDVFLFISAFLLSLSSMRKINEGKPLAPIKYWLHVFQRLLPAAATVVAGTVIASFIFLAPSRVLSIVEDAIATLFYFLNWRLAFNSVDYYAQDAAGKTPLQHFWSLSMQGQIFILWPLLFLLVAFLARKLRFNLIASAALVFGTIFTASLVFSVIETYSQQGFAYFDTRTRLWEFAAGTLLALISFKWKAPTWARIPMGWVGIAGLISCGFVLPVQQAFPGYLALWPLISGALVIMAGQTGSKFGADVLLSSKPMLKLGEISYALYLVHWPVFVIFSTRTHEEHPGFIVGTVLILVSMVIAWAIHTFIEQPLRKDSSNKKKIASTSPAIPWKATAATTALIKPIAVIGACLLLVGVPLTISKKHLENKEAELVSLADTAGSNDFPGALALDGGTYHYKYSPIPATDPLSQYDGLAPGSCTQRGFETVHSELAADCGLEVNGPEDAPKIMVVGGSHAGQSVAFYKKLAQQESMNLMDYHVGGCRYPIEAEPNPTEACYTYNDNITDEVLQQHPTYVALMITQSDPITNQETLVAGIEDQIKTYTDAGIKVIGLRDNPRWSENIYDCAQTSPDNPDACGASVSDKLAPQNPAQQQIDDNPMLYGLDFTQELCPEGTCSPIIGNVYVYMDNNHVSKAYGSTLTDTAERQLEEQGWTN